MTTEFPSYERDMTMLLLTEAAGLGIKIGTDGVHVVTVSTSRVPLEVSRRIHAELAKHKAAVIAIIEAENVGGGA
jgi:hypothetical protein